MMRRRLLVLMIVLVVAGTVQAETTTSLRQERVASGDIAELKITFVAGIPSLYALDTEPLLTDFEVLDTRSRISRVKLGNRNAHRMEWRVSLLPRRSGRLRIPPLKFGENLSDEMWLDVESAGFSGAPDKRVFVEIEAIPRNPYPGQQVQIVMRLLHNLERLDGSLIEPRINAAAVFRGGIEQNYETQRDGKRYRVRERSILIAAEASGTLVIPPVTFRGSLSSSATGDDEGQGDKRYLFRRSEALELQVRAVPEGFTRSGFLPARAVEIQLQRDEIDADPVVGDSIGLSLSLRASGVPASVLPKDLLVEQAGELRIFADREVRDSRVEHTARDLSLHATLEQRFVLVLDRAGEVTLPPVALSWWDVQTKRLRREILPALTLNVQASNLAPARAPAGADGNAASGGRTRGLIAVPLLQLWPWALGLIITITVLTLIGDARIGLRPRLQRYRSYRESLRRLRAVCLANHALQARAALLDWARHHWRDRRIVSLRQLAARTPEPDWTAALSKLDAAAFAAAGGHWDGKSLWHLVKRQRRPARSGNGQPVVNRLPSLYPR